VPSGAPAERRSSTKQLAGVAAAAGGVLTACGFGPATIEPHSLTPDSEPSCAALLADLPDVVSDAVRRDVRGEPDGVAAWGDPLIVLRCGVPLPPEYRPEVLLTELDGVAWLDIEGEGGTFFATVDRDPIVEVAVPEAYAPESDVLADLAGAIAAHIPERPLR
jgi:hypothetical protein